MALNVFSDDAATRTLAVVRRAESNPGSIVGTRRGSRAADEPITAKNQSGADLERGDAVGIFGALDGFAFEDGPPPGSPVLSAGKINGSFPWAVTLEPIRNGEAGPVAMDGIAWTRVELQAGLDEGSRVGPVGSTANLIRRGGRGGTVLLLETGAGAFAWALVRLGDTVPEPLLARLGEKDQFNNWTGTELDPLTGQVLEDGLSFGVDDIPRLREVNGPLATPGITVQIGNYTARNGLGVFGGGFAFTTPLPKPTGNNVKGSFLQLGGENEPFAWDILRAYATAP